MYYYAQIDKENVAFSILQSPVEINDAHMIARPIYDANEIGKQWTGFSFDKRAPAGSMAEMLITNIVADKVGCQYSTDFSRATVPVDVRLAFSAEYQADGQLLLEDGSYLFPIRSRDGRERVVVAEMHQGIITFSIHFEDSRVWELTEAMINADLPPERHMRFKGIKVFAVEA